MPDTRAETLAFLPSLLTRDYALIDEAARRLLDGTCCLQNEEKESAFDLFCKLRSALNDHILFEEHTVFPALEKIESLTRSMAESMKRQHQELASRLEECMKVLLESDGQAFRTTLSTLLEALRRHRALEAQFWCLPDAGAWRDDHLKRMIIRTRSAVL